MALAAAFLHPLLRARVPAERAPLLDCRSTERRVLGRRLWRCVSCFLRCLLLSCITPCNTETPRQRKASCCRHLRVFVLDTTMQCDNANSLPVPLCPPPLMMP